METKSSGGLEENVAGLVAYITFIPALIFLLLEPYNKNNFIRFHAFQSIFFTIAMMILQTGLHMFGSFVSLMLLPIYGLLSLTFFVLWIICMVKALNHEKWKLPIIGDLAEQQASKA